MPVWKRCGGEEEDGKNIVHEFFREESLDWTVYCNRAFRGIGRVLEPMGP